MNVSMNWQRVATIGVGVIAAGFCLAIAWHEFVEMDTPDAAGGFVGVASWEGAKRILLPAVLAIPAFFFSSWVVHVLLIIGLPGKPSPPIRPNPPTPDKHSPPYLDPNNVKLPIPADMLKQFSLTSLRQLSADLAGAGRYEDVATVAKVAREWGDK